MECHAGAPNASRLQPLAFVSHTGADHDFVQRLIADIERDGADVWVDDVDLHVGDSIPAEVEAAITAATHFIPVLSRRSLQSEWVLREVDLALDQSPRKGRGFVLPCVLDDCDPPPCLRDIVYADFGRNDYATAYAGLRERLLPTGPIPISAQAGLKRLLAADPMTRVAGLHDLAASAHPAALAGALRALRDPDAAVRAVGAEALGSIGDPATVEALRLALKDDVAFVRQAVAAALSRIDEASIISSLTPALYDVDDDVQRTATEGLYRFDRDRFAPGSYHARITLNVPGGRICVAPVHVQSLGHSVPEERWLFCRKAEQSCAGCDMVPDGGPITLLPPEERERLAIKGKTGFAPPRVPPDSSQAAPMEAASRAMRLTESRGDGASVVVVEETSEGHLAVTGIPLARAGRWARRTVTADDLTELVRNLGIQDANGCPPVVLPYRPGKRDRSPLRRVRPRADGSPPMVGWVRELWYSRDRGVLHCSLVVTDREVSTQFKAGVLQHLSPEIAWGGAVSRATGQALPGPLLRWVAFTYESTSGDLRWVLAT